MPLEVCKDTNINSNQNNKKNKQKKTSAFGVAV